MSAAVTYHRTGSIGFITLDRPDNRNSMTPELLEAFAEASAEARADSDCRCAIITGNGHCFSAGADLKSNVQLDADKPYKRSYAMYESFLTVLDIEVPVIGALNGHAVGGGFGLSLVCDVRIANREAKYGANFVRLGLTPGMAISYLLPQVVGLSRAAELLFSAQLITGERAAEIGLVSEALEPAEVLPRSIELAERIASNAPLAVAATKRLLYANAGRDPRAAALREAFVQAEILTSEDCREGMSALLEKRTPQFSGR